MTDYKSSHALINALRTHGSLILALVNNGEGYYVPGRDARALLPSLEKEAVVVIHMDPDAPSAKRFVRIRSESDDLAANLIFMAGSDLLLPQSEYEKPKCLATNPSKGT